METINDLSTIGEDLARYVEEVLTTHEQSATANVTDCDPSVVKAGRILNERQLTKHVGCAGHRLQSSAGVVFTDSGVTVVLSNT